MTLNISDRYIYIYIIGYNVIDIPVYMKIRPDEVWNFATDFVIVYKVPLADWIQRRIGGEIELQEAIH